MAIDIKAAIKSVLNKLNLETSQLKAGDYLVEQATRRGVHVPNAAAAPTKAEFDALLTSLRNADLIEKS